jgi:hypothetical protein
MKRGTLPAKVMKLVEQEVSPPHHLSDQEEQALGAAVTQGGSGKDRLGVIHEEKDIAHGNSPQ